MTEILIKRVDLYDIGNNLMVVDAILYNRDSINVMVRVDISFSGVYGEEILSSTSYVSISANSYTVFRSEPLEFKPKVIVTVLRNDIENSNSESRMVSNIAQGSPPDPDNINMSSIYSSMETDVPLLNHMIPISSLTSIVPITLQSDTINLFDGAPVVLSGSSAPSKKIGIYNVVNNNILTTVRTNTLGKYSIQHHMISGMSSVVTFSIRACNMKGSEGESGGTTEDILDLSNISNQVTITVKPVTVVKYAIDATYTELRNRDNGTISIPKKNFPSMLDALPALKTKAEQVVIDKGGSILRFEYGYESTTSNHIFHVTWYYLTEGTKSAGYVGNNIDKSLSISTRGAGVPIIHSMLWWVWWLLGILAAVYIANTLLVVFLGSSLGKLLPDFIRNALTKFSDFISGTISTVTTGIFLIAAGYVIIKIGPSIMNYVSARKTEKALSASRYEPKQLTA